MGLIKYSMDPTPRSRAEMRNTFVYDDADDRIIMLRDQDRDPIYRGNLEKRLNSDGYNQERDLLHAGTIPMEDVERIIIEEGWNPMLPENSKRCLEWLDRNPQCKTTEARVARSTTREYFRGSCSTKLRHAGDES